MPTDRLPRAPRIDWLFYIAVTLANLSLRERVVICVWRIEDLKILLRRLTFNFAEDMCQYNAYAIDIIQCRLQALTTNRLTIMLILFASRRFSATVSKKIGLYSGIVVKYSANEQNCRKPVTYVQDTAPSLTLSRKLAKLFDCPIVALLTNFEEKDMMVKN